MSSLKQFGMSFGEGIIIGRKRKIHPLILSDGQIENSGDRLLFFILLFIFGLGIIYAKLFSITIIEGERYSKLSVGNRVKEQKIPAPRGIIYDRKGTALIRNIPMFVGPDNVRYFEEKPASDNAHFREEVARDYVYSDTTAHVLGYTGEVGDADINSVTDYKMGDIIGKSGIEEEYDKYLRGKDGKELIETDALGEVVRTLGKVPANVGENLTLTLDINLQKSAKDAMGSNKGAIVVSDPSSGEIYALYSSPSFDPNLLIRGENVSTLFTDVNNPLFNRPISGQYPPGSTFKMLTSLAALDTGVISKNTQFEDTGVLTIGKFSFGNWYFLQYGRKEGWLNLVTAIKRSNDIYFYKTGEAMGIERLARWVKRIGGGSPTGIDLPGESSGLMPDLEWQKKEKGEPWYLGDTYHVAIGQGDLLATPVQVNTWTNIVASVGKKCKPHFLKSINSSPNESFSDCKDLGIKNDYLLTVKEGMKGACSEGGTGYPMFNFRIPYSGSASVHPDGVDFFDVKEASASAKNMIGIPVACKTGTAEYGDPKNKTHAWFTVFAPVEHPQISVTVLVEGGGEGSTVAAPIAKKILEKWFKG